MSILRVIFVLLFIFVTPVSIFSDEAFDFFVETCRHSGYNPTEIATFQAELKVVTQTVYPDSVVESNKQQMADRLKVIMKENDAKRQQTEEEMREAVERMFSDERKTEFVKISLRNSAAPIGLEDRLGLALVEDTVNKRSSLFQMGTHLIPVDDNVSAGTKERISMFQPSGGNRILIDEKTRIGNNGGQHHSAGRIMSPCMKGALRTLLSRSDSNDFSISDANIAAYKKICDDFGVSFTLSKERMKYEGDYSAYILEAHEKEKLRERYWIDPDRGYICPKEEVFHPIDGTVMYECVSEKFILDQHSQKWFPAKYVYSSWSGEGQEKVAHHMEIFVTPGTLIINQPIPDSVFALTVQKGTRVEDFRRDDNDKIAFYANQTGTLDLDAVEKQKLDDISLLSSRDVRPSYNLPAAEKTSLGWARVLLISVGIAMIVFAIAMYFTKKEDDRRHS